MALAMVEVAGTVKGTTKTLDREGEDVDA